MRYLPLIFLLSCTPDTTTQVAGKVLRLECCHNSYILFEGGHMQKVHGYYAEPGMDILCTVSSNGEKLYYFTLRDCLVLPPAAPVEPEFGTEMRTLIERPL